MGTLHYFIIIFWFYTTARPQTLLRVFSLPPLFYYYYFFFIPSSVCVCLSVCAGSCLFNCFWIDRLLNSSLTRLSLSLLIIGSAHYTNVQCIRIHNFLWTKEMLVLCNCVFRLIQKPKSNNVFYLPWAILQTRMYSLRNWNCNSPSSLDFLWYKFPFPF